MWRVLSSGGLLFVRDLCRPAGDGEVDELVFRHSGSPSADARGAASFERQKSLLRASLSAALTVTEIAEAALALGIPEAAVTRTSDRHWTLAHRKP